MERSRLIFWRNFLALTFVLAFLLASVIFLSLYSFREEWVPFIRMLHVPELIIVNVAALLFAAVLLLLCPMLSLHFMIRRNTDKNGI